MGRPTYDDETLAGYFCPLQPSLFEARDVGSLLQEINAATPEIVNAVADVDRSQIRDFAAHAPWDRLRVATARFNALARFRGTR
ncbi:MAG: hypothetical protein IPM79_32995 [Polyangiaceae bacterium]|nr:hypothetical protein [Polyangiaceae bacterium]MBK8942295.1 hypothetical protein [Polyangiaceae bacterium]